MKTDANRGITNITYNYLGLAEKIELTNGRSIEYVFTADGQKLCKTIKETGKADFVRLDVSMDYMGELIYHDGVLVSIDTPEGRAVPLDTLNEGFTYQFFIATAHRNDHLGSLRVAYGVEPNGAYMVQVTNRARPWFGPTAELLDVTGVSGQPRARAAGK